VRRWPFIAAFLVACTLLVLFFHQEASGNGRSRLLTVWGLVEDHTYRGDRWHTLTFDKSYVAGHFYSDKAPLASYVLIPFYWLWRTVEGGAQTPRDLETAHHLGELVASAIPFSIFALLIYFRLRRTSALSPSEAVWWSLLAAFGTSIFNYGNSYFSHVLAGTLFLASYLLAVERERHFAWAGLLGGCAVLTEYPLIILVGGILLLIALDPNQRKQRLLAYCAGALPAAALFFFHNRMITGHVWQLPYAMVVDSWKPMKTNFGMRLPNAWAVWHLSFSPYRGAFFYGPLLALLFPLLFFRFDGPNRRRWVIIGLCVIYYLFDCSYFRWDGGWCTGPRHLAPALMLCIYEGTAALARARSPRLTRAFLALAACGVAINLAFASTNALPSTADFDPLFNTALPHLWSHQMNPHNLATEWAGLNPHPYSLILWATMFVYFALQLGWLAERRAP